MTIQAATMKNSGLVEGHQPQARMMIEGMIKEGRDVGKQGINGILHSQADLVEPVGA